MVNVTLRDVAEKAGVSIKTVSRVVNNRSEIADETRGRVLSAIQELGYRPNVYARGLVSGKTLSVAAIITEITDPFFPELVLGIESVARKHGYSLFLCNTNADPQQELDYVDILAGKQVDGVMLCGSRLNAEQLTDVSRRHHVAALTSRNPQVAAVVTIPAEQGIYDLTSHLIRLGHRAIGHVGLWLPGEMERADGYLRALAAHGIEATDHYSTLQRKVSIAEARQRAQLLLRQSPEITAVSCYNDLTAIGVLQACADLGRRVPEDIAVVGFDDLDLASLAQPQLTTIHVPRFALGQMIMNMLLRVMQANGEYEERLYVDTHMVIRDSCGAQRTSSMA